ncbi:MAG: GGDEF domain-containing protein [Lachnospiraceae bacterium]|nr:GGDEF domain-containing protein [Lachnospiraceae bacterium]
MKLVLGKIAKERGISLGNLNILMLIAALVVSGILFVSMHYTTVVYRETHETTQKLIRWRDSSVQLQVASDYLTEQIRMFALTGEIQYLDNYFTEAKVTKRRDHALEAFDEHGRNFASYKSLTQAMNDSVELMDTEYRAAKLTAQAFGIAEDTLPEEVLSAVLTEYEEGLDSEEKKDYAIKLLIGEEYNKMKTSISSHMQQCLRELSEELMAEQNAAAKKLEQQVFVEHVLSVVLILIMLAIVMMTFFMIIKPLQKCVELIRDEKDIPINGAYEIRFLAKTYNLMYNANLSNKEKLTYAATHDKLTGLYNRRGYDFLIKNVDLETSSLVLFDIDYFKEVNDGNGHDVGDRILRRVSETIFNSFRSQDYVCRIGGDEFAVIMVHADEQLTNLMKKKIQMINEVLSEEIDGEPTVSVSAGMVFGKKTDTPETIFKKADEVLYQAKGGGRKQLCFYGV